MNPLDSNFVIILGHLLPQVWSLLAGLTMQCRGPMHIVEHDEAIKPVAKTSDGLMSDA